jgi:uncharacterized protein (DUF2062 family)
MKKWVRFLNTHWHHLVQLHDTPHSIAGGAAIGIFFGFTPFFGLKTLFGIGVAWGFRCSRVAAAIGVTLHDVILPLMPVLLRIEYGIGYWILNHPHRWPAKFHIEHLKIHEWFHSKVLIHVIWPTFIGSVVIGLPLAMLAFWLTLRIVKRAQHRRTSADAAALGLDLEK